MSQTKTPRHTLIAAYALMILTLALILPTGHAYAQGSLGRELALLDRYRSPVANAETRVRLPALFAVKRIAIESTFPEVKVAGLSLLREPVGSASDHIRIPALYAIADIARTTDDREVRQYALESLTEPFRSNQLAVRNAAIDALNNIVIETGRSDTNILIAALDLLYQPADSGNNGTRMPAVNAVWNVVRGSGSETAYAKALDLLENPVNAHPLIGGMEIRFMTIEVIERIGVEARSLENKRRAIDLLSGLPHTDESRAEAARARIFESM